MSARTWPGTAALVLVSAVAAAAYLWPFLASPTVARDHTTDAPWLLAALLGLLSLSLLAEQAAGRLDATAVAMIGLLSALGGGLRVLSAGTTGVEPMFLVVVLAGRVVGPRLAFLTGASCLLTGAFLTGGVGPWVPFQMIGTGWVALGAALLPGLRGRAEIVLLAAYGLVAGLAYGLLLNLWFWPFLGDSAPVGAGFVPGADAATNLRHYGTFYLATSLGWDLPRSLVTAGLALAVGRPILSTLRRGWRRASFDAIVTFDPPGTATAQADPPPGAPTRPVPALPHAHPEEAR